MTKCGFSLEAKIITLGKKINKTGHRIEKYLQCLFWGMIGWSAQESISTFVSYSISEASSGQKFGLEVEKCLYTL